MLIDTTIQMGEAVFNLATLLLSRTMAPVSRKPIPEIIYAGIRIKSSSYILHETKTNKKASRQAIMLVLSHVLLSLISCS